MTEIHGEPEYDEKSEALSCNINNRKSCWLREHDWINASLRAEFGPMKPGSMWSWDIENRKSVDGCGGVRFCRRCKKIYCMHYFTEEDTVTYIYNESAFYHTEALVRKCRSCGIRVHCGSCGVNTPSQEALDLIYKTIGPDRLGGCGSGFHVKLPVQVSEILQTHGEPEALAAINHALAYGVRM